MLLVHARRCVEDEIDIIQVDAEREQRKHARLEQRERVEVSLTHPDVEELVLNGKYEIDGLNALIEYGYGRVVRVQDARGCLHGRLKETVAELNDRWAWRAEQRRSESARARRGRCRSGCGRSR